MSRGCNLWHSVPLILNANLRDLDGSLKALSFILYRGQEQKALLAFYPLIPRWIQKSISLTDRHSLEGISVLLFGAQDQQFVKNILKREEFSSIRETIEEIRNSTKFTPLQIAANKGLEIALVMIAKNFSDYTNLDLKNNNMITDEVLKIPREPY